MNRLRIAWSAAQAGILTGVVTGPLAAIAYLLIGLGGSAYPGVPRLWTRLVLLMMPLLGALIGRWLWRRRDFAWAPIAGMAESALALVGVAVAFFVIPLWGMTPTAWAETREVLRGMALVAFFGIGFGIALGGVLGFLYGLLMGTSARLLWRLGPLYGATGMIAFLWWIGFLPSRWDAFGTQEWHVTVIFTAIAALAGAMAAAAVRDAVNEHTLTQQER